MESQTVDVANSSKLNFSPNDMKKRPSLFDRHLDLDKVSEILTLRGARLQKMVGALTLMNIESN